MYEVYCKIDWEQSNTPWRLTSQPQVQIWLLIQKE